MKRLLALIGALHMISVCSAHQDAIITLAADGKLGGLPTEYNPALLRVAFSESNEPGVPPISSLELRVGGKTVVVPGCVTSLFITRSTKDVRVVASWYHDTSTLPPYIDITLYDPGHEDARYRPGYKLLFNLSTAKLFGADVMILRDGNSTQMVPVDISERCSASQLREFTEPRLRPNKSLERTRER